MNDRGKLDQAAHAAIAQRMTLNERQWAENTAALMSVLGTRVQLGSMALPLATRMVKQGYATLTYFCTKTDVAKIAFLPDPVCARLAMCLMADQYEVSDREDYACHRDRLYFRGLPKKEWSRKLLYIFSSGLCHPHKGDLGEVVAALYLLFCGPNVTHIRGTIGLLVATAPNPQRLLLAKYRLFKSCGTTCDGLLVRCSSTPIKSGSTKRELRVTLIRVALCLTLMQRWQSRTTRLPKLSMYRLSCRSRLVKKYLRMTRRSSKVWSKK